MLSSFPEALPESGIETRGPSWSALWRLAPRQAQSQPLRVAPCTVLPRALNGQWTVKAAEAPACSAAEQSQLEGSTAWPWPSQGLG